MKKLNYLLIMLLLPAFVLVGCSDDNNGDDNGGNQIELSDPTEQTQEAYADNETTGGFTFTARSAWTATVMEEAPAGRLAISDPGASVSSPTWLRLLHNGEEKYSGGAGQFTLTIELDYNYYPGETRSATITITSGSDEISVTVTQKGEKEDGDVLDGLVTGISLDEPELILECGASKYLTATVLPVTAINKNVAWTSDNEDVASVSEGWVIAKSVGTAEITATTEDGEKTATCTVTVIEQQPTGEGLLTLKYDDGSGTAMFDATRVVVDTHGHYVRMGGSIYFEYTTNSGKLEAGTYTWGSSSRGWKCQKVSEDDVYLYFEEGIADRGTVTVSISGETYTITLDWKGSEGSEGDGRPGTLKGTYTGKVVEE